MCYKNVMEGWMRSADVDVTHSLYTCGSPTCWGLKSLTNLISQPAEHT